MAKYSCEICGKAYDHRGALNLHQMHCEARSLKERYKTDTCDHDWDLLNPHDERERVAMNDDYMEVCRKCQSLR